MDRRVIFCEDYSSVSVVFTEENLHGMMNREVYLCIDYYGKTFVALARSKFFDKYKAKIVWCEEFVPDVYDDLMKGRYEYRGGRSSDSVRKDIGEGKRQSAMREALRKNFSKWCRKNTKTAQKESHKKTAPNRSQQIRKKARNIMSNPRTVLTAFLL